jgi:hypothetical protein
VILSAEVTHGCREVGGSDEDRVHALRREDLLDLVDGGRGFDLHGE